LTQAIFILPFIGKNFFRGIVINQDLPFAKDAAYQLLKGPTYNCRRLLLCLERRLYAFFDAVMDTALQCVGLSKNNLIMNPES